MCKTDIVKPRSEIRAALASGGKAQQKRKKSPVIKRQSIQEKGGNLIRPPQAPSGKGSRVKTSLNSESRGRSYKTSTRVNTQKTGPQEFGEKDPRSPWQTLCRVEGDRTAERWSHTTKKGRNNVTGGGTRRKDNVYVGGHMHLSCKRKMGGVVGKKSDPTTNR